MLSGIKVLDFSRVLAGPLCTMALGDLGADVVKVERPAVGDDTRGWGPPFDARGQSAYFLSVNRNKRSLAADLDNPVDQKLLAELAAEADVVVDNFRPGMLEARRLGYEAIRARNRRVVWCTITGFGADSVRPGYDFVLQAESGWMSITGEPNGEPMKVGVALADVVAGKDAALAVLAALVSRAATGEGRRCIISLAASATAALVNVAQNVLVSGSDARRWGNAHPNLVPYQLFNATDRAIVVAVGNDGQWLACARALELPEFADDPALASNAGRLAQRRRVVDALATRIRERPAADWLARLAAAGVPSGVVRSVREALRDVEATAGAGVAPSIPGTIRLPPPLLDEHGASIRRDGWRAFRS